MNGQEWAGWLFLAACAGIVGASLTLGVIVARRVVR